MPEPIVVKFDISNEDAIRLYEESEGMQKPVRYAEQLWWISYFRHNTRNGSTEIILQPDPENK